MALTFLFYLLLGILKASSLQLVVGEINNIDFVRYPYIPTYGPQVGVPLLKVHVSCPEKLSF